MLLWRTKHVKGHRVIIRHLTALTIWASDFQNLHQKYTNNHSPREREKGYCNGGCGKGTCHRHLRNSLQRWAAHLQPCLIHLPILGQIRVIAMGRQTICL